MWFMAWCTTAQVVPQHSETPLASPELFSSAEKTKQRTTLTSTMGWKRQGSVLTRACTASLYFYLFLSRTHRETNTKCTHTYLDNIQRLLLWQEGLLTCCQLRVSENQMLQVKKWPLDAFVSEVNKIFAPSSSHQCDHTQQSYKYSHSKTARAATMTAFTKHCRIWIINNISSRQRQLSEVHHLL